MSDGERVPMTPDIRIKEVLFVADGDKIIPVDDVTIYYVTVHESFRIRVKIVSRTNSMAGNKFMIVPENGDGQIEVYASQLEVDLTEYYS